MKKDKEWLKEEVSDKITPYLGSTSRRFKLINLIDEMDQPKLPSIPQFVAEYIKVSKDDNESLNQAFAFIDDKENKELWNWMFPTIYEGKRENQETFARAWLDGYTVEEDKMYRVVFPFTGSSEKTLIQRIFTGNTWADDVEDDFEIIAEDHKVEFTEKEIKSIDERYWAFAEPVE